MRLVMFCFSANLLSVDLLIISFWILEFTYSMLECNNSTLFSKI